MPLSNFTLTVNNGWTLSKSNPPFQPSTQGPDSQTFDLSGVSLATYTEAYIASNTLAAGASADLNLNSFTDVLGTTVTATKALSLFITASGPSTAICRLTASPTNGLSWFLSCPGTVTGGVTGAAAATGLIRIQVASTTNLSTGQRVNITGVTGTTEANGTWLITVIDGTHFDLQGSTFTNAWVSGGTITLAPAVNIPSGGMLLFSLSASGTAQTVSSGAGSMRVTNVGTGSLVVNVVVLVGP